MRCQIRNQLHKNFHRARTPIRPFNAERSRRRTGNRAAVSRLFFRREHNRAPRPGPSRFLTELAMRIRLDDHWVERLLRWPESGMGYQRVDVRFVNGRELKDVPVFNAEEIELPDEVAPLRIADLELHR